MIQIDTNRWRWLQIALMADLQAIDPTADVENSIKQSRICKPQLMPVKTMTRALWFLQKAGKKLLARKVADLKSCWPQKLLARKVAGLKSCWRQKLLRWSEVLIKHLFFRVFARFFVLFFASSWTIWTWRGYFSKKSDPACFFWPQGPLIQKSAAPQGSPPPTQQINIRNTNQLSWASWQQTCPQTGTSLPSQLRGLLIPRPPLVLSILLL